MKFLYQKKSVIPQKTINLETEMKYEDEISSLNETESEDPNKEDVVHTVDVTRQKVTSELIHQSQAIASNEAAKIHSTIDTKRTERTRLIREAEIATMGILSRLFPAKKLCKQTAEEILEQEPLTGHANDINYLLSNLR